MEEEWGGGKNEGRDGGNVTLIALDPGDLITPPPPPTRPSIHPPTKHTHTHIHTESTTLRTSDIPQ